MQNLSDDLLHSIASAIDAQALGRSTGVCRRLRSVATREQLWSPHLEALFKELPPELDALAELTRLQDLQAGFPALGALVANDKIVQGPAPLCRLGGLHLAAQVRARCELQAPC